MQGVPSAGQRRGMSGEPAFLFDNPGNKAILVDALSAAGVITAATPGQKIFTTVEEVTNAILSTIKPTDKLVDLNKRALVEIRQKLLGGEPTLPHSREEPTRQPHSAQDIADARKQTFNSDLEQRQKEFEQFMQRDTPADMDFSDKRDKPLGAEMDTLLAEAASRRKIDMNPNEVRLTHSGENNTGNSTSDTVILAKIESIDAKVTSIEVLLRKLIDNLPGFIPS